MVLLKRTDLSAALLVADKVRQHLLEMPLSYGQQRFGCAAASAWPCCARARPLTVC